LKVITLTTDFGLRDPYVSIMKAVIKSINPNVDIIDITHNISKFNVDEGAYVIYASYKYFPKGTIHVGVVDPGVGSKRRAIAIKTKNYYFIGPDNGLLYAAAVDDGIVEVRVIENRNFMLEDVSATFHGRDIFSPTAAYLSLGLDFKLVGKRVDSNSLVKTRWYTKPHVSRDKAIGNIMYIDSFGNLITNIKPTLEFLKGLKKVKVHLNSSTYECKFARTFSDVQAGEMLVYNGSLGFLEIGVNLGSAFERLKANIGSRIIIEKVEK